MTTRVLQTASHARAAVVVGLIGFTALSWGYLFLVATRMGDMSSVLAMPMSTQWTGTQTALMLVMWSVMMAAMMLPSAVPMITAYDRLDVGSRQADLPGGSTSLFVGGYVVTWAGFAALAVGLQWLLQSAALVNGMGVAVHPALAGGLLIGAGLYQATPLKEASLGQCRTPMGFLMTEWRDGRSGALKMGIHHGAICVGCCWALMALLFVLGVMNLAWVTVLAGFVLVEKVAPIHTWVVRIGGASLIVWGVIVIAGA